MTASRLLWIEFRRNAGIWFVLPIVAICWYLLNSSRGWIPFLWSETNSLLQEMMIPLAGPALTGLAAWMAGRDRRRGLDDLLETTSRPVMVRRLTVLAGTALWVVLAYVIFAAYMLGRTARLATWGRPALWPILIVLAALLAYGAWGFLAGSLFSSRFTAPLAAIVVFGAGVAFTSTSSVSTAGMGGTTVSVDTTNWVSDLTPNALSPVPHWQLLFYVGLIATALVALPLLRRRDLLHIAALALAVVLTTGSVVMIWGNGHQYNPATNVVTNNFGQVIHVSAPVQPTPVCAGQPVTVCTNPAWKPVLDKAIAQANGLAQPLLGLPGVPLRVERNEAGLSSGRDGDASIDLSRYADRLVADDASMPKGAVQNEAQLAIRGWLLQRQEIDYRPNCEDVAANPDTRVDPREFPGWPTAASCAASERFAHLPPESQRSWLEAHYTALRAGKLTPADLP
jgi:hypothetical protein